MQVDPGLLSWSGSSDSLIPILFSVSFCLVGLCESLGVPMILVGTA